MSEQGKLLIQVDPRTGVPVYRQVMDQIRYYLASGVLKPGAQLPSIRQLAVEMAVNPTTIVRAYAELEHEGVIEMRHGKGAFIAEGAQRMSRRDCQDALRKMARQMAVESIQLGFGEGAVLGAVADALKEVRGKKESSE